MDQEIVIILKSLILPPGGLLLLGLLSLLLCGRLFGKILLTLTLLLFYLLSTPLVATNLIAGLERFIFMTPEEVSKSQTQAIVVLAGGRYEEGPEYGGDSIKDFSLERARYAAWLQRRTLLPIIVTGGDLAQRGISEAKLVSQTLKEEFGSKVLATEDKSTSTWENAFYTSRILKSNEIKKVVLVTHAWHMPRAVEVFQHHRVEVVAAPTIFSSGKRSITRSLKRDWLPSSRAFRKSFLALHEHLGMAWYRLKEIAGLT